MALLIMAGGENFSIYQQQRECFANKDKSSFSLSLRRQGNGGGGVRGGARGGVKGTSRVNAVLMETKKFQLG